MLLLSKTKRLGVEETQYITCSCIELESIQFYFVKISSLDKIKQKKTQHVPNRY